MAAATGVSCRTFRALLSNVFAKVPSSRTLSRKTLYSPNCSRYSSTVSMPMNGSRNENVFSLLSVVGWARLPPSFSFRFSVETDFRRRSMENR